MSEHDLYRIICRDIDKINEKIDGLFEAVELILRILDNCLEVESFEIFQILGRKDMADSVSSLAPGALGHFVATPIPAGATLTGLPIWTSSDPADILSANPTDPTGLTEIVQRNPNATGPFELTITYTNPDGTVATETTPPIPLSVVAPPPVQDVTGFSITQTDPVASASVAAAAPAVKASMFGALKK